MFRGNLVSLQVEGVEICLWHISVIAVILMMSLDVLMPYLGQSTYPASYCEEKGNAISASFYQHREWHTAQ